MPPLGPKARLALVALALMLAQVGWLCGMAEPSADASRYDRLCAWDSGWYSNILENGYRTTIPPTPQDGSRSNVGFFPAYPVVARGVRALTGLSSCRALLVTAQVADWGFWLYVLALLSLWEASIPVVVATCAALVAHPAAFFMAAGYSESLFMAALLGLFYWLWTDRPRPALAAAHGFLMSATRIVGVPVAVVPLAWPLFKRLGAPSEPRTGMRWLAAVAAASAAGGLSFLLYCRIAFGRWDIYMQTLAISWNVRSDYLGFFDPRHYFAIGWILGRLRDGDVHAVSQISVALTLYQLLALGGVEAWLALRGRGHGLATRAPLYAAAWLMFYASVSGRISLLMMGMIRYTYPTYALLALAVAHLASRAGWRWPRRAAGWAGIALLAALVALMAVGQHWLGWNFVHWQWAA